jgi:hypothetical protein
MDPYVPMSKKKDGLTGKNSTFFISLSAVMVPSNVFGKCLPVVSNPEKKYSDWYFE